MANDYYYTPTYIVIIFLVATIAIPIVASIFAYRHGKKSGSSEVSKIWIVAGTAALFMAFFLWPPLAVPMWTPLLIGLFHRYGAAKNQINHHVNELRQNNVVLDNERLKLELKILKAKINDLYSEEENHDEHDDSL